MSPYSFAFSCKYKLILVCIVFEPYVILSIMNSDYLLSLVYLLNPGPITFIVVNF